MKNLFLVLMTTLGLLSAAPALARAEAASSPLLTVLSARTIRTSLDEMYRYPADEVAVVAAMNMRKKVLPEFIVKLLKAAADQVLKAINIALQRLQNKEIDETNKAKIAEAAIHATWLKDIVKVGNQMRGLYETHYEDLKAIKEVVVTIGELRDLVQQERDFLQVYKAILEIAAQGVFPLEEQEFIISLAGQILEGARQNLKDVKSLISNIGMTMQDADRVAIIKQVNRRLADDLVRMRGLRNELAMVVGIRSEQEINNLLQLY